MSRPTPSMTDTAKEKLRGMWSSIRSMTADEDETNAFSKLKKAIDMESGSSAIENMMKTLFSSCTNGIPDETDEPSPRPHEASHPLPPTVAATPKEESYYSQFLSSEKKRAAQAVTTLRQQSSFENRTAEKSTQPSTPPGKQLPRPFPVSTPPRPQHLPQPRQQPPEISCQVQEVLPKEKTDPSFDDGISAISAHTLDEMVRQDELKRQQALGPVRSDLTSEGFESVGRSRSVDSSLFPPTTPSRSDIMEHEDKVGPLSSHQNVVRSYGSWKSRGSRSLSTRSTKSTQTSDFEAVWRKHEQKYWEDVVEEDVKGEDKRVPLPRKSDSTRTVESGASRHNTITTVGSSFSGLTMPLGSKHPHDTYYFEDYSPTQDVVIPPRNKQRDDDPDQLKSVLVMKNITEVGEI